MHTVGALEVMNQAVDASGVERVAAYQQWLNRKRLPQFGVLQMPADELPHGVLAAQTKQCRNLLQHRAETVERHGRQLQEADVENLLGLRKKAAVTVAIIRLYARDFSQCFVERAAVVELGVV